MRPKKPAQAEQSGPKTDIGGPEHQPPYIIWNIFICSLVVSFKSIVFIFLAEAARYESSYRRTAHHATGSAASSNNRKTKNKNSHHNTYCIMANLADDTDQSND